MIFRHLGCLNTTCLGGRLGLVRLVDPLGVVIPDHAEQLARNRHCPTPLTRLAAGILSSRDELTTTLPLRGMSGLCEDDILPLRQPSFLLRSEFEVKDLCNDFGDAAETWCVEVTHGNRPYTEACSVHRRLSRKIGQLRYLHLS